MHLFESLFKKILIIIVVLCLLSLAVYFLLLKDIQKQNEISFDLIEKLNMQTRRDAELRFIGDNLSSTQTERYKINSYFISAEESGIVDFIEMVESLGNHSGISLEVNSILLKENSSKSNPPDLIEDMKLGLKIGGDWSNIIYFLEMLDLAPYKISFDKVYIEKNDDKIKKDKLDENWIGIINLSVLKFK